MNTHRDRERQRQQKDKDSGCYGNKMLHSVWIQTWVFHTTRQKKLKARVGHFFVTPNINPAFLPDKCTLSYDFGEWPFRHIFVRIKDVLYEVVFILFKYLLPFTGDVNKYKVRSTYLHITTANSECVINHVYLNLCLIYLNINQLEALNFIISLFHASTCFEHKCSSSGGQNCTIQPLVSSHL